VWTTCEIRQAAKGITIPDKPLNSTSLQDGLQNFIVKGVPVPPRGSMVAGGILLVLISMGLTFIAGLIPSRYAANKDPVVALRTE
jgi:ABC-type lipoprotein release transport system permease subunit